NVTKKLAHDLFHNHRQASDEEIKEQLKEILENNDEYKENLQKLNEKDVSFNKFWSNKLYSEAYNDLYNSCDPDDPNSDIFLSLIIKYIFVSNEERTQANAIWTQAVLETIFDKEYLSPKINRNVIDMWIQKLLNPEDNENDTIIQKGPASFCASSPAISEAAIQENYELFSGDDNENDCSSDSNYEED
ncbi:22290_t:CDS:2, partial [Racocetra persica]